jgi:putative MFS transporter
MGISSVSEQVRVASKRESAIAAIAERVDALPNVKPIWMIVFLLSIGLFCEIYDASMTVYLAPGLVKAGIFKSGSAGLFGLSDAATFIAATFAGLWIGTLGFSYVSDRWGRLPALRYSMVWYSAMTLIMGFQSSALAIDAFRFLTGIGMGVQIVAVDCLIAEITPKAMRGRAFALSKAIQYCAVPIGALSAQFLIPENPFGVAGWRWLSVVPVVIAAIVLIVQRNLLESPRWLAQRGRIAEANAILDGLEAKVLKLVTTDVLPNQSVAELDTGEMIHELSKREMTRRILMMSIANFMQAIGYYGFHNWVPTLLQGQGADLSHSLGYSAVIALTFPVAPLVFFLFADKFERKVMLIVGCLCTAVFGMLFAQQSSPLMWIALGALVTIASNLMAFSLHTYQAEIFPTRARARAVGFSYSFTRLSTIFSGYIVAYLLEKFGVTAVFIFLDGALICAAVTVAILGPRTRGLALEQISRKSATDPVSHLSVALTPQPR